MKTISKNSLRFLFIIFSCTLFAQQTRIKISDYQYNSTFNNGRCDEYLRVTAHFSSGEPSRTFIDYSGTTNVEDREYLLQGVVNRLDVSVYARDQVPGNFFTRCRNGNEIIRETYQIPVDPNACLMSSIAHANNYTDQVTQSFSFNYQVIPDPQIDIDGTFNIEDNVIGYEESFVLSADEDFNENIYQWQYGFNGFDDWINIPRAPNHTLNIRMIDFLDASVIGREVFFRVAPCDASDTSNVISKRIRDYNQMTKINISDYFFRNPRYRDGRCAGSIRVTAIMKDGSRKTLERNSARRAKRFESRVFYLEGDLERIEVRMFGRDASRLGCRFGRSRNRARRTFNIYPDEQIPCNSGTFYESIESRNGDTRLTLSFDYKVTPMPKVIRPTASNIIGYEDVTSLSAQEGFNDNVYNWQYSFLEGTPPFEWIDLPGVPSPTLEIILADIFDESVIGKEIFFRTSACDNEGTQNIVGYQIRRSAPHIIDVATKPVSCYDAQDGEVTLTFNRPLREGDLFGFSISDQSDPDGDIIANANNISAFDSENKLTIDNLPPSTTNFLIEALGTYYGETYFTGAPNHSATFVINRPDPVAFVDEPADHTTNVFCFGGQDGSITINAVGGIGDYEYLLRKEDEAWDENEWTSFAESAQHIVENLFPGTYYIKIRDGNECVAKRQTTLNGEITLGEEIIKRVVISQPEAPLFVTTEILNAPTAHGFEDGRILATITGGTAINGDRYEFEWRDENNNVITTTNAIYNEGQGYLVTLHSVGDGQYTIVARDANYSAATNKEGCTMTSKSITLLQPPPIEISIRVVPISCNATNTYSDNIDTNYDGVADQFQDGVLVATVTGGVPFDIENPDYSVPVPTNAEGELVPYFYDWKIQLPDGTWQEISNNDAYIDFLDTATNYSLNVTDKNGIRLGTYLPIINADGSQSYTISETIDVVEYLPQPEVLEIEFMKSNVTCSSGDNATLEAIVTGGVAPYVYEWSNGKTTKTINNLIAGTYLVFVTDANGCQIEGTAVIEQPNDIVIEPTIVVPPSCFEGNDGQIGINVTGGMPPYTYLWNTGVTSNNLQGLSAGTYRVEIIDAAGCRTFYEETLSNPEPVKVNLGGNRALCGDQSLVLDISIDDPEALYSWTSTNGFTSSDNIVSLTETGTYTATVTTGSGCTGIGEVIVEAFDRPIDSNFYITTQAYTDEDVILVNVSNPIGEIVEWSVPEGTEIISKKDEELVLRFENEGAYTINMRSYQGECYQDFEKNILVQPGLEAPQSSESIRRNFIEEFILYPNPNTGAFKTKISLKDNSNINVKIIDLVSGATMHERKESDDKEFLLDYSLSLSTGVYLMLLETPNGSETRKLIFR
ncbi:T9SS type A sorting domain-containing protein [Aquimarina gracilis]|uniref:T9SS type A sorting domain-containing protein n=1 Tax=Aquimarina gracilis TaxID=874422 RepID=A0ABU5ZSF9_9FLAO|nr:T9SS type A sorting domain-containing protein [Aquimarina gracilis]MEB3344317.1 T9SS type A sorting domain-containing protein [Aquimarina gracilis]